MYTFQGPFVMGSISGSISPATSFDPYGAYGWTIVYLGGNSMAATSPFCTAFYKYVGILYGSFAATPGAGITFYTGQIGPRSVGN